MSELGRHISISKGRKAPYTDEQLCQSLPYLTTSYFRTGKPEGYVASEHLPKAVVADPGDVVLLWDGANAGEVFAGLHGVLGSTMALIGFDPSILHGDFLLYYLMSHRPTLTGGTTGSTIPHVSRQVLEKLPAPPFDLREQRAIAHVLRTVQKAREATEQVIDAARELKKSFISHLVAHGPIPLDSAPTVNTMETDFGPVRADWPVRELADCAQVQSGVAKGRRLGDAQTVQVPYLRVANVQDGRLDLNEIKTLRIRRKELDRYRLRPGDVLLTEGGDFDKLGRGHIWHGEIDPCVHQNHVYAVRSDQHQLLPEFLSLLVQSEFVKRYFLKVAHRTTNLASINMTKLRALPLPLPPIPEQQRAVDLHEKIDLKILAEEQRLEALDALFSSLTYELMTGRIRISPELLDAS